MKTELTDEMIDDAVKCEIKTECGKCRLPNDTRDSCLIQIAKALQAERAERKAMHDAWEDAPEWATETYRIYKNKDGNMTTGKADTREPPKSPERLVAEGIANRFPYERGTGVITTFRETMINEIEKAILEAKGKLD